MGRGRRCPSRAEWLSTTHQASLRHVLAVTGSPNRSSFTVAKHSVPENSCGYCRSGIKSITLFTPTCHRVATVHIPHLIKVADRTVLATGGGRICYLSPMGRDDWVAGRGRRRPWSFGGSRIVRRAYRGGAPEPAGTAAQATALVGIASGSGIAGSGRFALAAAIRLQA